MGSPQFCLAPRHCP